ncbi:hypothetical protein INR49_023763 [Caranx melampygus]|nr:hypothetical protein INR49_023763 [Caranx melampygus]
MDSEHLQELQACLPPLCLHVQVTLEEASMDAALSEVEREEIGDEEEEEEEEEGDGGRAQAGEPDPGCSTEVQAPVEADGVGVHEEQVSLSKRLDFRRSGVTYREAGDACSQDQETQGQGHLQGGRVEPEVVICGVWWHSVLSALPFLLGKPLPPSSNSNRPHYRTSARVLPPWPECSLFSLGIHALLDRWVSKAAAAADVNHLKTRSMRVDETNMRDEFSILFAERSVR